MKYEYDLKAHSKLFESENWIETNIQVVKLIFSVVTLKNIQIQMIDSRWLFFDRLFSYFQFHLEIIPFIVNPRPNSNICIRTFREKLNDLIKSFILILDNLPPTVRQIVFNRGLNHLFPTEAYHTVQKIVHENFYRGFKILIFYC